MKWILITATLIVFGSLAQANTDAFERAQLIDSCRSSDLQPGAQIKCFKTLFARTLELTEAEKKEIYGQYVSNEKTCRNEIDLKNSGWTAVIDLAEVWHCGVKRTLDYLANQYPLSVDESSCSDQACLQGGISDI